MCTITETANGTERTTNVTVDVAGDGQQVTIPQNSTATATVTDTYDFVPGSLTVVKNITGAGAGLQGAVTIHVDCGGGLTQDFVIPAGTPAGPTSKTLDDIPAGSTCTVTRDGGRSQQRGVGHRHRRRDGHRSRPAGPSRPRSPTTTPSIPARSSVTKTIAGGAAGDQGAGHHRGGVRRHAPRA